MGSVLTRGTNLPTAVETEIFSLVRGKSTLAKLSGEKPIPFNGVTEFVFGMDKEADIVGENGAKSNGGGTFTPVVIRPIKMEYGMRTSDEFRWGTEDYRMDVWRKFAEGAAVKFARGLDIAALHGMNPRTGQASAVVGTNNFDSMVTNVVGYDASAPDGNITSARLLIESVDAEANGIGMAPVMADDMSKVVNSAGAKEYPDFKLGGVPETLGGMILSKNTTVAKANAMAYLGDFSAFRWGYASGVKYEVIEYGNPDNDADAGDLKGHNQVYLRAEVFLGWGILAPAFFSIIRNTGALTVASVAGTNAGDTKITVTESKVANTDIYKYSVGTTAAKVVYGQDLSAWTTWDGTSDITAATGKILTLAECTSAGKAVSVGTVTVTAHA